MKKFFALIIPMIAVIYSCEKIVATNITDKVPVLILPQANDTVQTNSVHFKWEEMEGAEKYRLLVVSPSFSNLQSYVLDTFVYGTDFFYTLDSNEYQLKLYGVSASYHSDTLGPITFWVGTQSSGSTANVVLDSPDDLEYTNSTTQQFEWNALSGASSYEISIRAGANFETGSILDAQNNISTTVYTSGLAFTEGSYSWGVKAFVSGSETLFSTRRFYVDLTNPNQANLSLPTNAALVSSGIVNFSWSNGSDPGTIHAPVSSFIEIATDSGFGNVVESQALAGTSVSFNMAVGNYYWRVSNSDAAGNLAPVSNTFQLTVF